MKQRGRRATGDVVTEKREAVDQNGKTEDNSRSSESIKSAMSALFVWVSISVSRTRTVHRTRSRASQERAEWEFRI